MDWVFKLLKSSIGMKALMALSGAGLLLFVIAHMVGNLLVFLPAELINGYAANMKSNGAFLWFLRLGLLATVVVHVVVAFKLYAANRAARPVRYALESTVTASPQSRTMIISGGLLAAFVVYHLLHFTVGAVDPTTFADNPAHLYNLKGEMVPNVHYMMVAGFSKPVVTISYVIAMLLLGSHLSHGISSLFQSLGMSSPRYRPMLKNLGIGLSSLLVLGNISMPVCVLLGIITHPAPGA